MPGAIELPVEILPMSATDIDDVFAIELGVCPFPWGPGNFKDCLQSGYSCRVCRIGGELVGYFVVMLAVDDAHLLTIGVADKWQGKGFGARLLRHAMHVGREQGAQTFLLEVRPSNAKAVSLYRHFGFKQIGVRRNYYPAENGREDALVMTYPLAELTT
ncbi:ribosomal protein S18-alanine N-acetyltransferase [Propionivibrio limicola]|uniref:ribosomal protein S18-alanine N-acetyltransferase n=1 Tax=Propionivibrio limicola TaxID=167645 RepID=UPI001291D4EA|nr:ribosomal protein S18-alanine N-acetyltransferase [Propionivibrio limicola]